MTEPEYLKEVQQLDLDALGRVDEVSACVKRSKRRGTNSGSQGGSWSADPVSGQSHRRRSW
jgi:hypothetical protein